MKRFFFFIAALFLFVTPVLLFAQDTGSAVPFMDWFISIPALAAGVLVITEFFKNATGKSSQFISWIIAFVLSVIGYIFHWGIFDHMQWWVGMIYALSAGLIANGLFDWSLIRALLEFFKINPETRS